jgi:hypothetical protein
LAVLGTGCSSIPQKAWAPVVEQPYGYAGYQIEQGPFVYVPLYIGLMVGSPLMLVTTPMAALCEVDGVGEAEIAQGMGFMLLGPILVGDIVGTPFLALKKTFFDFPIWVLKSEDAELEGMGNQCLQPDGQHSAAPRRSAPAGDAGMGR